VKYALVIECEEKRSLGRPRRKWKDMSRLGLKANDMRRSVGEVRRRAHVNAVMKLQVPEICGVS
jgi:hypothetical protein